jgi:signal transduction histidine kinase
MNLNLQENQNQTRPLNLWPQVEWPAEFWTLLFDQAPFCLIVFNREGRILLANDEAGHRLGLAELDDFILPESLKPLKAGAFQLELRGSRSRTVALPSPTDGNPMTFQLRHLPYGEEGLILATGLTALPQSSVRAPGVLDETAALATEVRRQVTGPLAGIELYASIVGRELEEAGDSALADLMERIRFGVREVNEYLSSFESMARPLNLNLESQPLMGIVDEALGAMNGVFKERGIGVLVTQKDLSVEVDRALVVQVLLNLLLNAVEAMPNGGRIFVEFETAKAGLVEIIITDTGPGVPMVMMRRIFSPFHTTKNQPLGLGLPVSQRIAEAHQGSLLVGSDLNMGARAVLTLPFMSGDPAPSGTLN